MKKSWIVPLVCTFALFVLIGLTVKSLWGNERTKVFVVLEGLDSEYWKIVESGAKKAFNDLNIDGKVLTPDSIIPTKEKLLKNVLQQNPDALIVTPHNPSPIIPILTEYKENNIPVLFLDTEADWNDKTSYIGTDNPALGKKAGELLGSMLQPGDKIALIGGTSQNADERIKGAKETLEAAGIITVTEQFDHVDDIAEVRSVMSNILNMKMNQTNSDIKGVFATFDTLALKVLQITEEKGLKIPVVGADGSMDMVKAIEAETLTATVTQNPYDMGYLSVEHALKAIKGETVEKTIDSGIDIITKDNAKEKLDFLEQILIQD
ncbi:sugar ABC transporter substrate-binding protein [Paenibacillus alkaliterrae]|uniref:sugar ABC transporter substrate-binding protein n=1 Tax=Paenibacillus alkaliterrae TaxID=320909 RepID=UPI001F3C737C|nr:sugar ABC transporter substrate-binding protein [Paenibacillus alkaliterrae]MCF2941326.1 sugar ABC transporter substrate-binding protein [Paenibacillus alkaliterrae]